LLLLPVPARAQSNRLYYSVTGIRVRQMINAVQIVIQTDGAVRYGFDFADFFEIENDSFRQKASIALRLRLIGARTKVPTFTDLSAYPVDAAIATLGTEPFRFASESDTDNPEIPRVDVIVRFYVPILFNLFDESDSGSVLRPRQGKVALAPDRRSILITVMTDRVETVRAAGKLDRSPEAERRHRLLVTPVGADHLQVDVLHTPLPELARALSAASGVPLTVQTDVLSLDTTLSLPSVTLDETLGALRRGYGLGVTPLPEGGFALGRTGPALVTEQVPLRRLAPETARQLLPDFLLPQVRADDELNALIVTAPPAIVAKVRADLARLDRPRPQVRVQVDAYAFSDADDAQTALAVALSGRRTSVSVRSETQQLALRLGPGQAQQLQIEIEALRARERVRLQGSVHATVVSGATGTLFAGQTRFVTVIRSRFGQQQAEALRLPIGTTLTVTPLVAGDTAEAQITLELAPRFTTLDTVEARSNLPTIGLRELSATLRVRPGDTVALGSLDTAGDERRDRRLGARRSRARSSVLLLVTATLVAPESAP
jgi:hypothetical protein